VGCFVASGGTTQTTTIVNLLDPGDVYGEGYWNFDLKFAKNIRFAGRRLNVGVDVYNLFNNDAIRGIQQTYPGSAGGVVWSAPTVLLSPRFARLSVQFDF
jgi:outer membrane receptor protein involved in Fe transport